MAKKRVKRVKSSSINNVEFTDLPQKAVRPISIAYRQRTAARSVQSS